MTPTKLLAYFKLFRRMSPPKNPMIYLRIAWSLFYVRWCHFRKIARLKIPPPNLVLLLTSRCNKDCSFCHYEGELNPEGWEKDEMTLDGFVQILDSPSAPKVGRVCFYGGEPLLNRDIFPMIEEAKSRQFFTSMITNGLMIEKYAEELKKTPLDLMTLSYYPEDREKLAAALPLLENKRVINLSFIVSDKRLDLLEEVFRFAYTHHIPMVTIENLRENEAFPDSTVYHHQVDLAALKKYYQQTYGNQILIRWSDFSRQPAPNESISCPDFWDTFLVNSKGQISPCCQYPLAAYQGSVLDQSAGHNAPHVIALREEMLRNCVPSGCEGCHYLYAKDPLYR